MPEAGRSPPPRLVAYNGQWLVARWQGVALKDSMCNDTSQVGNGHYSQLQWLVAEWLRVLLKNSIYVQEYITQHWLPPDSFVREVCCKQIGQGFCEWGSLGAKYSFDIADISVSTDHFTMTANRIYDTHWWLLQFLYINIFYCLLVWFRIGLRETTVTSLSSARVIIMRRRGARFHNGCANFVLLYVQKCKSSRKWKLQMVCEGWRIRAFGQMTYHR